MPFRALRRLFRNPTFGATRDLSDPVARSAVGAACLLQYREDWEARAEVDVWGWNCFDHSPGVQAIARAIDLHESRVLFNVLRRSHE